MKPESQWLHRPGLLACCLSLAACSNTPKQPVTPTPEPATTGNYYLGQDDVYAHLQSGSGGSWILSKITKSEVPPAKGYLLRLNDLAPAFDTRVAECTPQNYPTNHKCNPVHPFRSKDVGFIGKIISGGIAAGTAGKVTDISRTYKTSFDEAAFNQAVDEALTNTGFDTERRNFFAALESYAKLFSDSRSTLIELEREADAKYRNTETSKLDIRPKITGLTEYYTNDIDFRDLVKLLPRSIDRATRQPITEKTLLPCDARSCLQDAQKAIASIRADVENVKSRLAKSIATDQDVYDVRCDSTTHAGYLFTLKCPVEVARTTDEPALLPISLHILARDFDSLYPRTNIADENLSTAIDGEGITFTNLTSAFLTVTAQTVYYNSQVQTSNSEINVAPGATAYRSIAEFVSPAIVVESSYRQITPDKARSTSFRFGFAAKYRVAGETSDTTLYELRTFNVACAISNRVKPGSCKEAPAGNKQVPGVH